MCILVFVHPRVCVLTGQNTHSHIHTHTTRAASFKAGDKGGLTGAAGGTTGGGVGGGGGGVGGGGSWGAPVSLDLHIVDRVPLDPGFAATNAGVGVGLGPFVPALLPAFPGFGFGIGIGAASSSPSFSSVGSGGSGSSGAFGSGAFGSGELGHFLLLGEGSYGFARKAHLAHAVAKSSPRLAQVQTLFADMAAITFHVPPASASPSSSPSASSGACWQPLHPCLPRQLARGETADAVFAVYTPTFFDHPLQLGQSGPEDAEAVSDPDAHSLSAWLQRIRFFPQDVLQRT